METNLPDPDLVQFGAQSWDLRENQVTCCLINNFGGDAKSQANAGSHDTAPGWA
jgi:hypothetical protein